MGLAIGELKALAFKAGFNSDEVPTAAAIAMAESSGNPTATNTNTNGSTDKGLWQINSVNASALALGNPFDPATNASMAYKVYKQQGWRAWVAYTNGTYRKFVDTKTPYATLPGLKVQDIPGTNTTLPDLASKAVTDIPSAISSGFSSFTGTLTKVFGNASTVLIAVVLLALGVLILMRSQVGQVVAATTPAGKAASLVGGVATVKANPDVKAYTGTHRA